MDIRSKTTIRALGRIHLCGVLHITWQTRDGVDGKHMISLLYRDCLVLASAGRAAQVYTIQATIGLNEVRVEEVDNGRGMLSLLITISLNISYLLERASHILPQVKVAPDYPLPIL